MITKQNVQNNVEEKKKSSKRQRDCFYLACISTKNSVLCSLIGYRSCLESKIKKQQ